MEGWFQSHLLHFEIRIIPSLGMLLVLLLWVFIFIVFTILGISIVKIINVIPGLYCNDYKLKPDEYFLIGFLTLSLITGILSIFIPIGQKLLLITVVLTLILLVINFRVIRLIFTKTVKVISDLEKAELILLAFFILFVLMAVVQKITWFDTQAYHAQNIQWIQKYPVVPGLGNLHDRFAFNSMFFVISALFTFHVKDILIFPLNGICFVVLIARLFVLYKNESDQGITWKAVFYILLLLISLLIMIPVINTPSPDIICATLTIYVFILIFEKAENKVIQNYSQFILLSLLIFSCVSYKLSSLFLAAALLFFLRKDFIKRSLILLVSFILIISPFVIRNYYLSGYLIYPFPAIDIFNVDWKVPIANVIEIKSVIEAWARIRVIPYPEVLAMKFPEWVLPWFKQMNFFNKLLVVVNLFSVFTLIIMLFRKDYFLAKVQLIILINLVFWFIEAPDPRFSYGCIFIGFSLTFSYLIKLAGSVAFFSEMKYLRFVLACFLIIIISRRIMVPVGTLREPSLWILPSSFPTVQTNNYFTNFHYRIPVDNGECYYTEIPCVTYPLNNVYLRGNELSEGFRVLNVK